MDLDLLAAFLEIYRAGSLSAAATARGVSQPALSGQLARLERSLGYALFDRTPRGVTPTPRADELAFAVAPHLDGLRGVLAGAAPPVTAPLGPLRLAGAAEVMSVRVLPSLAPLFGRGLVVTATFGLAADLLAGLARGEHDLVVSPVRPTARGLRGTPLIDEEFVLVGAPSLAVDPGRLAVDPVRALARLPLVAYAADLPIIRRYWRSEFGRRPPNPVALVAPDLRAVLAAVIAGVGVSVLPRYLADPALAAGSVLALHRPQVAPLNTLYLVTYGGPSHTVETVHRHLLAQARTWGSL